MRSLSLNLRKISFPFTVLSRKCSAYPPEDPPNVKIRNRLKMECEDLKNRFNAATNFFKYLVGKYEPPIIYPPYYIKSDDDFPFAVDILIVGGGIMGLSVAYWLKNISKDHLTVCILEKDVQYNSSSTLLSLGGIRQQFSLSENVKMSLFGSHFIKNAEDYFSIPLEDIQKAHIDYYPQGYLLLASNENSEEIHSNYLVQRECGSLIKLMSSEKLKDKFPWMNMDGIKIGAYGLSNEGWFNPWQLMMNYKTYALFWGSRLINGEILGFEFEKQGNFYDPYNKTIADYQVPVKALCNVRYGDGSIRRKHIQFSKVINAMGPHASKFTDMLDIGTGQYGREVAFPVEPRKRYVYVVNCPDGPILDFPFLVDNSGLTIRRLDLKGNYVVMLSPHNDQEPPIDSAAVDFNYFYRIVWPILIHRIPCFKKLKIINAWSGLYDYNFIDQNPIIGTSSWYSNVYFINGFSGYGAQHSPAAGRAIAELLFYSDFQTIDLRKLSFDRFRDKNLLYESCAT